MLTFNDVTFRYPGAAHDALTSVTFEAPLATQTIVEGSAGSGKSSIAQLLLITHRPSSGTIRVGERNLAEIKGFGRIAAYRRSIGVITESMPLLEELNVFENIAFAIELRGDVSRRLVRERTHEAIEFAGLGSKAASMPVALSGGERRKAALARALVNEPSLLVADDPLSQLDPESQLEVLELLERASLRGIAVLHLASNLESRLLRGHPALLDGTRYGLSHGVLSIAENAGHPELP